VLLSEASMKANGLQKATAKAHRDLRFAEGVPND
jgi:hypothetical protein